MATQGIKLSGGSWMSPSGPKPPDTPHLMKRRRSWRRILRNIIAVFYRPIDRDEWR
jgi:hypothetical protein